MKIAILSDIHANLSALEKVLSHCQNHYKDISYIHLGDCIDYGMRPNETINKLLSIQDKIIVNLKGNHERALCGFEKDRFSSKRGAEANLYTKSILTDKSKDYINKMSDNVCEFEFNNKKILCIHGDLTDTFWGKMDNEEILSDKYLKYDYVISGHTHISSLRTIINKEKTHKTLFINPGSVGQPRNLNPNTQYCVIDLNNSSIEFHSLDYDIETETKLYKNEIDLYYRDRLYKGT